MASRATITYNDYSGEKSTLSFRITDLTAGNVVAQTGLVATLQAAINPIILGTVNNQKIQWSETIHDDTLPTDLAAQRETKWLVSFRDVVNGKKGSMEIPTAEAASHLLQNSDKADMDNSEISAMISALEAVAKSVDGNTIDVLSVTLVGRAL